MRNHTNKRKGALYSGINRGGYVTTLPPWYGQYLDKKAETSDRDVEVAKAVLSLCDNYLPQYIAKLGEESFPKWLNHCVDETQ